MTLAEVDAEDQGLSRRNLRALAVPAPRLFGMRTVHHYMYLPAAARIPAGAVGEERPPAAKQKSTRIAVLTRHPPLCSAQTHLALLPNAPALGTKVE